MRPPDADESGGEMEFEQGSKRHAERLSKKPVTFKRTWSSSDETAGSGHRNSLTSGVVVQADVDGGKDRIASCKFVSKWSSSESEHE